MLGLGSGSGATGVDRGDTQLNKGRSAETGWFFSQDITTDATNYKPENIPPILRFYDSITNSFVGTANASREKYTTSGTFEAQGGSRLNYRYLPSWGPVPATSGATGAISTIEFSEGKS